MFLQACGVARKKKKKKKKNRKEGKRRGRESKNGGGEGGGRGMRASSLVRITPCFLESIQHQQILGWLGDLEGKKNLALRT